MKGTQYIVCFSCGKDFFPFGKTPINPPAYGDYKCPHCGKINRVYFDADLQREVARKELKLDINDAIALRIDSLEKSNESMEKEIEVLQGQIAELQSAVAKIISPDYRQKVASEIVSLLTQIKADPPKEMYRG